MTPVTYEFHRVCPKWFMTLWYARHKPCTYLVSRLAQSPKGLKRASTWASHIVVPSGRPKRFLNLWYVRCKPSTYLGPRLALSPHGPSFHLSLVTTEYYRVCPKWVLSRWYVWCKLCSYLALTLTLSPNRKKWDSTWPTSPRSSTGCIQNNFWAYGTFDQTLHLSCLKISTLSERTKMRFHLSLVT
jgi:hypothetical protein